MNKSKIKNVVKATGILVKESCKLVAVIGQGAATGMGVLLVVDTSLAGVQEAANVRGKRTLGVHPQYAQEGHLWNKKTVGVVNTPLQSFTHSLLSQKKGGK